MFEHAEHGITGFLRIVLAQPLVELVKMRELLLPRRSVAQNADKRRRQIPGRHFLLDKCAMTIGVLNSAASSELMPLDTSATSAAASAS